MASFCRCRTFGVFVLIVITPLLQKSESFSTLNHEKLMLGSPWIYTSKPFQSRHRASTGGSSENIPEISHGRAVFEQAVKYHKLGQFERAKNSYTGLIAAIEDQCVPKKAMAEVYVNIGNIYSQQKDIKNAKKYFTTALEHRNIGTAHVNLALIALSEGKIITDKNADHNNNNDMIQPIKREFLLVAIHHCEEAIKGIENDIKSGETISSDNLKAKLLAEKILQGAKQSNRS